MRRLVSVLLTACCAAWSGAAVAAPLDLREAVRLGLQSSPDIELQRLQQRVSEAVAAGAQAPFDMLTTAGAGSQRDKRPLRADEINRFAAAGADQQLNQDSVQLGVSRLLESGMQLGANYAVTRAEDNVQWAQAIPRQTSDRLTFSLRVPLQKNPGNEARAVRGATELESAAAMRDTEQVVARTVLNVALAYWDWAARLQAQAVAASSEARVQQLRRETEKLIEQDELPPAEMNLLEAAVTERATASIGAAQRSLDARTALARLYGMDAGQTEALEAPSEALPEDVQGAGALEALRAGALERRADLAALRLREQAMQERLAALRDNAKPVLDLELSAYYAGLRESSRVLPTAPAPIDRHAGPGVAARLAWQWAPAQSAINGALASAIANADAARVRRHTLEQNISATVEAAYRSYASVVAQLRASTATVQRYRSALKDTQSKRLMGTATLIDVLNVEDRLNNAILARVQYQQGYAAARALVLYEAGNLLLGGAGQDYAVALERLLP